MCKVEESLRLYTDRGSTSRQCRYGRDRSILGAISTKNDAALRAGIHGHLYLIEEIAEAGGRCEARLERTFLSLDNVIGAIVEGTAGSDSAITGIPAITVTTIAQRVGECGGATGILREGVGVGCRGYPYIVDDGCLCHTYSHLLRLPMHRYSHSRCQMPRAVA